ncbi:MAG: DUF3885 domain-containing protein [Chitinophagaceae bacterium]|nr:MAG: DUF3885 domain-containing protein [Chitinophagaceae bacterium]
MNHRIAIEETFMGRAFLRPLFYSYPGGLRFELSQGGHAIDQFLTAHHKASEICRDVFSGKDNLTICLRVFYFQESRFAYRSTLRDLADAGIKIPRSRSIWLEEVAEDCSLLVAFSASATLLPRLLWCALSADLGSIRPRPLCSVYLFNLDAQVMAFPYDDRGMDVVGSNSNLLEKLYRQHSAYLLEHDLEAMRASFDSPSQTQS